MKWKEVIILFPILLNVGITRKEKESSNLMKKWETLVKYKSSWFTEKI